MNEKRFRAAKGWAVLAVTAAAVMVSYLLFFKHWLLTWGADASEINRFYPGEDSQNTARIRSTQAISIHAPAEKIWEWLVQLGQNKAGFYSYTFIENALGADIHNVTRREERWQELHVGDEIKLAKNAPGMKVVVVRPGSALTFSVDTRRGLSPIPLKPGMYFNFTWAFLLAPQPDGSTRLISRWTADWGKSVLFTAASHGLVEWGAFIMSRRMLLAIRDLAEDRPGAGHVPNTDDRLWFGLLWPAGIAVVAAAFGRRRKWAWPTAVVGALLIMIALFVLPPHAVYVIALNGLLWSGAILSWKKTAVRLVRNPAN